MVEWKTPNPLFIIAMAIIVLLTVLFLLSIWHPASKATFVLDKKTTRS